MTKEQTSENRRLTKISSWQTAWQSLLTKIFADKKFLLYSVTLVGHNCEGTIPCHDSKSTRAITPRFVQCTSREMPLISWQNGLRLLSSRFSGYRQKLDGHALIGRCDDLQTAPNSKISEVEFLLVDFLPFIFFFCSCIVRTFCICRSPHGLHGLLSCLSFSACANGRDVHELDDLFVVLLLVYREPSSWRSRSDHVDENKNRRFLV